MDLNNLSTDELAKELKRRSDAKANQRKDYKNLVDDVVPDLVKKLKELNDLIADRKTEVYKSLESLNSMKKDLYGVKSNQRSHTFSTKNGDSIEIGYRITDGWDDTVNSGEAKVWTYLSSLGKDENSRKLVKAVERLLKRDVNNNLKASRVMELKALAEEWNSEEFSDGVAIIMEAYRPKSSAYYIKASYKGGNGAEMAIPLSISAVDFTEDVDLSIFKPDEDERTDD